MPTINFELRNRPDKKGYCPIRIVVQDKGSRIYISLPIRLLKEDWDSKAQKVKSSHSQHSIINNVLKLKRADLDGSLATEGLTGKISLEKIAGRKVTKTPFLKLASACLEKWEKTKAPGTLKAYYSRLRIVNNYAPGVYIEDVTPDWLARYEQFCWTQCKEGGTLKRLAFVSVIIKEALRKQIIEKDPFLIYTKPIRKPVPKIWLTVSELKAVEKLAKTTNSSTLQVTAYWFLFSCYTGLRYSDIEKFNSKKSIQAGRLILYTQKTGDVVSIKITKKIKELLRILNKLGPVFTNQKSNQYLKAIAHHANINKNISFHTSRHSFAVNCANLGISQEVTAKLLGHSDLRTTSIYYKIINTRVDKEMQKWDL